MLIVTSFLLTQTLLEAGADPVLQDCDGRDGFDYCPFNVEYVKALLRQHAGALATNGLL